MRVLNSKYASGVFLVMILLAGDGAGQTPAPDSAALSQQVASLFEQGKLDEAIPVAKKVVAVERSKSRESDTYAMALANLGLLHKERLRRLLRTNDTAKPEEWRERAEKIRDDGDDAEKYLRESLAINRKRGDSETLAAAATRNELGWVLNNYLSPRTTAEARARIDEAEGLYTETLAIHEKLTGADSDTTLKTALVFGEFYLRWINFEKALPFYERYIAGVEKKYGTSAKALVPALRGVLETLVVTMRDDEAKELAKRIGTITGRDEPVPASSPRLSLRGRKIEKVKLSIFAPPDFENDPRSLFSYIVGAGAPSLGGITRVKHAFVSIVVDEEGNVIEAKSADPKIRGVKELEEAARNSKFRPFVYKGTARKMRGALTYTYFEN